MVRGLLLSPVIQVKKRDQKNPAQLSACWIYYSLINSTSASTNVRSLKSFEIPMTHNPENRAN